MINNLLDKYLNNEKRDNFVNYNLDAIKKILLHLGSPHKKLKCIHVAGTNGKGTTSWILASILEASGYKTALYTSPHLIDINERIRINHDKIRDSDFIKILSIIENVLETDQSINPTYFDVLTVIAFCYFADNCCDIAVIETGLGGRLDSTNVIDPLISIITDISIDHTNTLGATIDRITFEKAGIIKHNRPVITSNTSDNIFKILSSTAQNNCSDIICLGIDFFINNIQIESGSISFDYKYKNVYLNNIVIKMFPEHQVINSSLAITAGLFLAEKSFTNITSHIIIEALKDIKIPGRCEILCELPLILYDTAHNYSGLEKLFNFIDTKYNHNVENITVFVTLMNDKATPEVLKLIREKKYQVIYVQADGQRTYKASKELVKVISDNIDIISDYINSDNNIYVFTGTFRLYQTAIRVVKRITER